MAPRDALEQRPLKVAIDIRFEPGATGGIAPAVRSLITSLACLNDGPEEYLIVVTSDAQIRWLSPLGPNQRFVRRTKRRPSTFVRRAVAPALDFVRNKLRQPSPWPVVPVSDGFYESLGCDVLHCPAQEFVLCALPSIYNPHDLQHLHYPQFFPAVGLAWRETMYPAGCRFARTVVVNSQWIKDDLVRQYELSPAKVQVIPEAPATELASGPVPGAQELKERYRVQEGFALYPSVTWPHKNHLRLLDALAYLRDRRGLTVPLVCTGSKDEATWPQIEQRLDELGLVDQVRFLGFVPHEDLRGLYRLARCLVLPTLFEANSLPIFEAWLEGTPVASSNVTALPEQVMDAGLLFDPFDRTAIGDTIARLFTDAQLCAELRERGRLRLADFDWARTARAYRAVYRRAAGHPLGEEDRFLLEWDWMRDPRRA